MLLGQANEEIAQLGHKTKGRSIKVLMLQKITLFVAVL